MIGIDTNVVIRYLVRDDEAAYQVTKDLFRSAILAGDSLVISIAVLLECEWVLRSNYRVAKAEIVSLFAGLLASREVRFEDEAVVELALKSWQATSADFADCVIFRGYLRSGCTTVATFDKKASVLPGATLLRT